MIRILTSRSNERDLCRGVHRSHLLDLLVLGLVVSLINAISINP
jgi:hypothetical protein